MTKNASLAMKAAADKLEELCRDDKDGPKYRLVGGLVLDVVAAILHQWEAASAAKKGA